MSLSEGQQVELQIEKAAAGGWMIARYHGEVVLVRGAIPGERVLALVERAEKRMAYASAREVLDASPDRRDPAPDPSCGGALYSHIAYPRQLTIKADVIRDAFARVGRHRLNDPLDVAGSPETGYRMRARFHVRGRRVGFYREGTHQICDARATGQMRSESFAAIDAVVGALDRARPDGASSIALTENIEGTERAVHVDCAAPGAIDVGVLDQAVADAGLMGATARDAGTGALLSAGDAIVTDPLRLITGGDSGALRRHAESFFQGNRYLLGALVAAVVSSVPDTGEIVDLYAGVGIFAVALAAAGRLEVTAVEADRASGDDLRANARMYDPRLRARVERVEDYLGGRAEAAATVIVDPPRTGLSKPALQAIVRQPPSRVVYVSCDPPTLARDARILLDAGYSIHSLRAFDFFPTTPHVETLAVFTRP